MQDLVANGLTANSSRTYANANKKYFEFCAYFKLDPCIIDEQTVLRFITYLKTQQSAPSTIRVYLSGLRAWALANSIPCDNLYSPKVRWALKAVSRLSQPPTKVPPLGYSILASLAQSLTPSYDNLMIFSSMLLAYFSCLRSAEYCPSPNTASPLTPEHISFHGSVGAKYMVVRVNSSKTAMHGFRVVVGCSGTRVCAVCWIAAYLEIRPFPSSSPLFITSQGIPLSHSIMTSAMRSLLLGAGYPPNGFTPHSLRAGAATDAAQRGLPDSVVQQLGRWKSDAFRAYLRPSDKAQSALSARLAGVHLNTNN